MDMSLFSTLQALNVTDYESNVLSKTLKSTDLSKSDSRLLLTRTIVKESSLLKTVLNITERAQVHGKGLPVRAFDQNGREYDMRLRYLDSNKAYRMIHAWSDFLWANHGVLQVGDEIELCTFRIPREGHASEIGMALIHHKGHENMFHDDRHGEGMGRRTVKRKRGVMVKDQEEGDQLSPEEHIGIESLAVLRRIALASEGLSKSERYAMGNMYISDFQGKINS